MKKLLAIKDKKIFKKLGSRRMMVCFLIVLAAVGIVIVDASRQRIVPAVAGDHDAKPAEREFYEIAYQFQKNQLDLNGRDVKAGVIPHHLLAADLIAEFFSNLAGQEYDTIILLGPNHFNAGRADVITSADDWRTPYGVLEHDGDLLNQILSRPDTAVEEDIFSQEHAITSGVTFIKKTFPAAKFLPLILRRTVMPAQAKELGEYLFNLTAGKKILVLANTDFSHYQDSAAAQQHDMTSRAVLHNFDFENIYNLDVDSPASLTAVMSYSSLYQARFRLLNNSNSAILSNRPGITSTTSYITGYWGDFDEDNKMSLLFFGDIMLDRHVKDKINQSGFDYLLDKFNLPAAWQTPDVMMANLEGAVTAGGQHYSPEISIDFAFDPKDVAQLKNYGFNFFSIANNHTTDQGQTGFLETQKNLTDLEFDYAGCADRKVDERSVKIKEINGVKIGFLAYSMVYGVLDEEKMLVQIKDAKTQADLVIVNMHWGVEYEQQARSNQVALAHKIIDAGADMLIGGHPHVTQEMEIYNRKPIFYSLGNFIFDQYFSPETQEGLGVGLSVDNGKMEITLLPFQSKVSQVELIAGNDKQKFLNWLAGNSKVSEEYREQIKDGKIKL